MRRFFGRALLVQEAEQSAASIYGRHTARHPRHGYFDDAKPLSELFPGRVSPGVFGADYYALLASAGIVLNLHRDEDADIGNIRCFEATGLGACLLTDRGEELREFFDVENEIATFSTVDECREKAAYLIAHPEEMRRIAENGQRKTLARHTVRHRARAIAEALRGHLKDGGNVRVLRP